MKESFIRFTDALMPMPDGILHWPGNDTAIRINMGLNANNTAKGN
jgi:hypothetical protein